MSDTTKSNEQAADVDALRRENETLRRHITELETLQSTRAEEMTKSRERLQVLEAIVDNSPSVIFVKSLDRRYIVANKQLAKLYGVARDDLLDKGDADFFPPGAAEEMHAKDLEALNSPHPLEFEEIVPLGDDVRHFWTIKFAIRAPDGSPLGICGIATEVTERKRQEAERLRLREEIISAQEAALRELSTPLMPIAQGVVAMPLVGTIDEKRAELIVTALLDGVSQQGAHTVIMDITGVRRVDAQVAEALVRAARSVGLLGARVIVTGVRPEVARTLVDLGADFQGIVTRATLRSAIALALGK